MFGGAKCSRDAEAKMYESFGSRFCGCAVRGSLKLDVSRGVSAASDAGGIDAELGLIFDIFLSRDLLLVDFLRPFGDVAVHIKKTKSVWGQAGDWPMPAARVRDCPGESRGH